MKQIAILLLLSLFSITQSKAQTSPGASESHNFITYDTTFNVGYGNLSFILRITRPANMFTKNSPDTASRPAIIHMAGASQVGTNASLTAAYGPHYLLANGWDGGIPLGNGRHYPIIISVQSNIAWPQTNELYTVLTYILNTYHIKKNSVHLCGMDMGACAWSALICHQASAGAESGMKLVTSLVALQGQSNSVSVSVQPFELGGTSSYASFGRWAKKYKGKYLGLEGAGDNGRYLWKIQQPMNDSLPGSAYFAYENYGGGGHCCWNSMYDTAVTDWQSVAPITNSNVKINTYYPNSMGTYKKGSNIFQWMLRQGDTTMVAATTVNMTPPTVSTGSAQTITLPLSTVTLTGSATPATGTTISKYAWTQVSGLTSIITNPTSGSTTVTGLLAGTYVYKLTVTSNTGATASSNVTITVNPAAILIPIVSAGIAQIIALPLSTATLAGNATPATGTTISKYAWTQVSGPASTIMTPASASTTVTGLAAGTYIYKLTATSNTGATASNNVTVTVNATATQLPIVSAGASQTITLPTTQVSLQGSATAPSGATIKTYTWRQASGAVGAIVTTPSSATTTVTGLKQGSYVFILTATTSTGTSAAASMAVTVNAAPLLPVVSAGSAQTITLPTTQVSLQGSATAPSGATIKSYAWQQTSGATGAIIATPSSATTTVTGLKQGSYSFTLTATTSTGTSATASMAVTVNAAPLPPVVSAGAAQTITLPTAQVSLQGSATAPSGATIKSYAWQQTSGTAATITTPSSATTTVTGLKQGSYSFTLTATTSTGTSATASMAVTVNAAANPGSGAGSGPLTVKKVIVSEYRTWYIASDGNVYAFNAASTTVVPFPIGGRKAIDGAGGFNVFRILDDQGYIWSSQANLTTTTTRFDTDVTGAAFNGNVAVYAYESTVTTIRSDGSVWYFGDDTFHLFHSTGGVNMKPTRLSPSGMVVKKIAMGGNRIVALTTAGDVYEWTFGKGTTPAKKTIPRPAIDIFASHLDYAGCIIPATTGGTTGYPYVWGYYFGAWGGSTTYAQPTSVQALWGVVSPIKVIDVNWNTTHYIDDQNRMWGLGFNVMGEVGIGSELVNQYNYSAPYAWTFQDGQGFSGLPAKQIGVGIQWSQLFSNNWFAYYKYAMDVNGNLYSWGRNKALDLGNGFLNMQEQYYPNSMDVLVPTKVTPLTTIFQRYNFTLPTISAGTNQTITGTTVTLQGSAAPPLLVKTTLLAANGVSTVGFRIISYQWTKVSGPTGGTITSPNSASTTVTGLTSGTYVFALMTTDDNTGTQRATTTITVNSVKTAAANSEAVSAKASSMTLDSTFTSPAAFTLAPNPVRDNFILSLNNPYTGVMNVQVISESGAIRKSYQLNKGQQTIQATLSVSDLTAGIYFVRVQIGSWIETKKLLKL